MHILNFSAILCFNTLCIVNVFYKFQRCFRSQNVLQGLGQQKHGYIITLWGKSQHVFGFSLYLL